MELHYQSAQGAVNGMGGIELVSSADTLVDLIIGLNPSSVRLFPSVIVFGEGNDNTGPDLFPAFRLPSAQPSF